MDSSDVFYVVGIIWSFTLLRSILVMLVGKNIFKRASKNEKSAFYPIINLFTMLEICDMSTFWGILLFVPILNIVVLFMMSYKLGNVFNTSLGYKIGLVVFPLMFYSLLAIGDKPYKLSDEQYFKSMESMKGESINLMTDEEIKKELDKAPKEETIEEDSIFKSNIQMMEQVETYKAAKIDLLGMEKLKNHSNEDDPTLRDLGFVSVKPKKAESEQNEVQEKQDKNESEQKQEKVESEQKQEKVEEKKDNLEMIDL